MARNRGAGLGKRLIVSLVSIVVLFGALEAGLRLFGRSFQAPPLQLTSIEPWFDQQLREQESGYVSDPVRFWRLRPGSLDLAMKDEINAEGFRGPSMPLERAPGSIRIAVVGDSCTYGIVVPFEGTYGERMREMLEALHPDRPVEVLNAGTPGYTTYQGALVFRDYVLPRKPDAAVLYFGWNDAKPGARGSDREAAAANLRRRERVTGAVTATLERSVVCRMLRRVVVAATRGPSFEEVDRAWVEGRPMFADRVPAGEFEENLDEMIRLCDANGILPIVVLPEVHDEALTTWGEQAREARLAAFERYRSCARRAAERGGAAVLDMREIFAGIEKAALFRARDPIHPNENGYLLLARGLVGVIEDAGILAGPGAEADAARGAGSALRASIDWNGDAVRLHLDAGRERAGDFFAVLPSRLTSDPPVGRKALLDAVYRDERRARGMGFSGHLDAEGRAEAVLRLPPGIGGVLGLAFTSMPSETALHDAVLTSSPAWISNRRWVPLAN